MKHPLFYPLNTVQFSHQWWCFSFFLWLYFPQTVWHAFDSVSDFLRFPHWLCTTSEKGPHSTGSVTHHKGNMIFQLRKIGRLIQGGFNAVLLCVHLFKVQTQKLFVRHHKGPSSKPNSFLSKSWEPKEICSEIQVSMITFSKQWCNYWPNRPHIAPWPRKAISQFVI